MKAAQERWARAKKEGRTFRQGDLVWLEGRNLKTDQPASKLAAKRYGPFPVAQVLSPITYRLTLPEQWKIHPVFHVDLLTPYKETTFHGVNYTQPPPDLINDEEEYEVEQILDSRIRGRNRKIQYLVKWVGYPDSDNQWLDADQVTADDAIREFKRKRPNAVTHLRRSTTGNPLIDFPLMSSPTPSTIENVLRSDASSPHEYSLAAPLTATDLQQVLEQFPDPTQPPDRDNSLAPTEPITNGLDANEPVVVWTLTPPSSCPTQSISQTTPQCVPTTQRYAFPVPPEDPTAPNSTSRAARHATRSVRNQAAPPIVASAGSKPRPKPPTAPNTSHREMRPSTTWGQYIRTQGGRLWDPAYPASSGTKRWVQKKKTKKTPATRTTTPMTRIPSRFQPWDVQLRRTQELVGDGQQLTRNQACVLRARRPPLLQGSC